MGHLVTLLSPKKIIVQDSFNRADNALSLGSANTGQVWSILRGTWGVQSNRAYLSASSSAENVAYIDALTGNVRIRDTIRTATVNTKYGGVAFRITDANNYYVLAMNSTKFDLWRQTSGVFTNVGSFALTMLSNTDYDLEVVANGNMVDCYLNGILRFTYTIPPGDIPLYGSSKTIHGIHTNDFASAYQHDNFRVEAL